MRRTLLLLPVIALAAPLFTSCGEDEASAAELIQGAPDAMADVGTMRFEMSYDAADQTIEAEGAFDLDAEQGTLTMQLPEPAGEFQTVFDGTTSYFSAGLLGEELAGGAEWVRMDLEAAAELSGIDVEELLSQQGTSNPAGILEGLEGVSEDGIEELGGEDVRGVPTQHYAASIDMAAAIEQAEEESDSDLLDSDEAQAFLDQFGDDPVDVDVWIDDDGMARRMTMTVPVMGEEFEMSMEMFDFGEPVDIDIPDESETVDFLDALGGFLPDN